MKMKGKRDMNNTGGKLRLKTNKSGKQARKGECKDKITLRDFSIFRYEIFSSLKINCKSPLNRPKPLHQMLHQLFPTRRSFRNKW